MRKRLEEEKRERGREREREGEREREIGRESGRPKQNHRVRREYKCTRGGDYYYHLPSSSEGGLSFLWFNWARNHFRCNARGCSRDDE